MKRKQFFLIILIGLFNLLIFFYPKEMKEYQGCFGKTAYLEQKHNPFSKIPEELIDRIEIESLFKVCFGVPFYGPMHYI